MRRDSAANWTSNNPLLAEGEMGLELDSGRWKIGNGTSLWSALVYSNQIYTGSSVITDSSANTALRITQTGTGNALLVEDSTNVDNSPFIIDANGNVGIGTLSLPNKLNVDGTVSVTNINPGYSTTATSGGTLTLTNASTNQQFFTGTSNHTIVLPVVSTLSLGTNYRIHNNSTGTITINSSGSNLVYTIPPQVTAQLTCILTSGTSAASWDVDTTLPDGYTTTVTAAGTTTLTVASSVQQFFTGTLNQTLVMPVASTMNVGMYFIVNNNSTGTITIKTSALTDIVVLPANMTVNITCILNSGTTPASWDVDYSGFTYITGTGSAVMSTGSTLANATITGQLTSTLASGTAPLVVASNTLVSNLNAEYLNGNASSYFAPINSPSFTGNPVAITPAVDNNNTQLATTAFVVGQAASDAPLMDSTAAVGTSLRYARGDHVHASDTSRASLTGAVFTGNISTPNAIFGYSTTLTAAGTTVLTVSSNRIQFFTGTSNQTVTLPVVSTLTLGHAFEIHNNSTGIITVQSSGANTVISIGAGMTAFITCIVIAGTDASCWDADYAGATSVTGTGSLVFAASPSLSGNVVIADNSASPALRITQTGTGNAFVVEDSASTDATPFVIDASGNVGIGTSSPSSELHIQDNTGQAQVIIQGAASPSEVRFFRANGSISSPTAVASGEQIGTLVFVGYDGAAYRTFAQIQAVADSGVGSGDVPGRLVFLTTADGGTTQNERMRIDSAGNVGIGVTSPTAKLTIAASTTSASSLNLAHGVAPTAPTNGDVWTTTTGMYTRINGSTVGPLGAGGGGGSAVYYQDNAPSAPTTGTVWVESDATTSVINSNDYVLKTSIYNESVSPMFLMGA
jgi:hypothetical protein